MKMSVRTRALVIVAASASLLAVPLAMPASAVAAPPGKCTKLVTKTVGKKLTATLSGCTPVAATGGKGGGTFATTPNAKAGTLNITITWATKHGTTKGTVKFATAKTKGKCPKTASSRITLTGKVTGGTGTALKTIKKNQVISGAVCVGKTSETLEPGTALKF
jgi:hypothetical protein